MIDQSIFQKFDFFFTSDIILMLFNSFEYIFLFLPVTLAIYFVLNHRGLSAVGRAWLLLCGLFYYSYWNIFYLPLLVASILVNFGIGHALSDAEGVLKKVPRMAVLWCGILFNVGLLGYFKYTNFFIGAINSAFETHIGLLKIALPLGISYFTFIQISFLTAVYRGVTRESNLLNYSLYVSFFPQLLSGPIVYHGEMMPQFTDPNRIRVNYDNIMKGVLMFSIGLFKKTVIADNLAAWAVQGFDHAHTLNFFEAWFTSLSYTFQLYNDFSGYIDMANGVALILNINLPINFNSPYKATSIQDYWRRFHITLIRFLRDHVYIPLGGSKKGDLRLYLNITVIFIVAGIWHGTLFSYIAWALMSSGAMITHRIWNKSGRRMNRYLAWFVTFNFINVANLVFRANSIGDAWKVLRGMLGMNGVMLSEKLGGLVFLKAGGITFGKWLNNIGGDKYYLIYFIIGAALIAFLCKNARELSEEMKPNIRWALFTGLVLGVGLIHMTQVRVFLYFNY
ncbi:MAG TPA: MBOAT family O-acyltransferase [Spirochaetota bacterium]|nr:MBOAT family O-acyltransferase [Spirochaetota bacterium]HPV41919.1 MBOAT family O-acyltransferase [Spirochaetota bacterium]